MFHMERTDFIQRLAVSHETVAKLDRYAELLGEWSQKFNLVAPSTIPHIWSRHFLDSAQLFSSIPHYAVVADLGSGAGFPGLVLSIMGIPNIHLIESTGKKVDFLRAVIADLALSATVHQARIEDIKDLKADIVTARALASLKELLPLATRLLKKDGVCLFLKGQNADTELAEARKHWIFDCTKVTSLSDASGSVLTIRNLHYNAPRKPKIPRRN